MFLWNYLPYGCGSSRYSFLMGKFTITFDIIKVVGVKNSIT